MSSRLARTLDVLSYSAFERDVLATEPGGESPDALHNVSKPELRPRSLLLFGPRKLSRSSQRMIFVSLCVHTQAVEPHDHVRTGN